MTRFIQALLILVASTFAAAFAVQAEVRYGAIPEEASWQADGSIYGCSLAQNLPAFGEAVFQRKAGRSLQLTIHTMQPVNNASVDVLDMPPAWQHGMPVIELATVTSKPGNQPIALKPALTKQLIRKLEQGRYVGFRYKDMAGEDVLVYLSSVEFMNAGTDFKSCLGQLLPDAFDDVARVIIPFNVDSFNLGPNDKRKLDRVARYIRQDPAIETVSITGHTDSTGRKKYNERLSQSRAEAVVNYLRQKGVPEALFKVDALGREQPIADNTTEKGRAKNRRVVIELVK